MAARKKSPGTAVANLQKQIAEQAVKTSESVGSTAGNRLRVTQQKEFVTPDGAKARGPINVVVLDFNTQNLFYSGIYDADNPQPPDCFSITEPATFGSNLNAMVPSENSPDKQSSDCKSCPMNQFGTDVRGRGKACKNTRLLAVVSPDTDPAEGDILLLSVSPSALRRWDAHVKQLAARQMLPVSIVTELSFDDNSDYPSLMFKPGGENPHLAEHYARLAEAQEMLRAEPDLTGVTAEEDTPRRPAKKKVAKKKASSRRRVA